MQIDVQINLQQCESILTFGQKEMIPYGTRLKT